MKAKKKRKKGDQDTVQEEYFKLRKIGVTVPKTKTNIEVTLLLLSLE